MRRRNAFTLVELLVVITIIVILLALLMPALNRAVYSARLAQCMGVQKAVVQAITSYAFQNRKEYPYRGIETLTSDYSGKELGPMQVRATTGYDVRPPLNGYIQINAMLQDPLVEPVDLEARPEENPDLYLEASYMMFWGWQYKIESKSYVGMYRLGDAWECPQSGNPGNVSAYNVLFSDMDLRYENSLAQASHPDTSPQRMQMWVWTGTFGYGEFWNLSRWTTPAGVLNRGPVDDNFAYDDGSVRRVDHVAGWRGKTNPSADDRMDNLRLQFNQRDPVDDEYYVPAQ